MLFKKIIFLFTIFFNIFSSNYDVDAVIFSFDRPAQLYLLLESMEKNLYGLGIVTIIYRASNDNYKYAYDIVKDRFENYNFVLQGNDPKKDFKPLTIKAAFETPGKYLMFSVDDIVVCKSVDLNYVAQMLENTSAHGFYLRLGKNITRSYMGKYESPVPLHKRVNWLVNVFRFNDGNGDWRYPNNVDMTIYPKKNIKQDIISIKNEQFTNPYFEVYWYFKSLISHDRFKDPTKEGLFFEDSKIVNVSINLVNELDPNYTQFTESWKKNLEQYSPENLLNKFLDGYKIDLYLYECIQNRAPHVEFEPIFIKR